MKYTAAALTIAIFSATSIVRAEAPVSFQSILQDTKSAAAFKSMLGTVKQPEWLSKESITTPAMKASINGKEYTVLYTCKAHNCSAQQVAILLNSLDETMYGVLGAYNETTNIQNLTWLNTVDAPTDVKTILFAALSGSLDNHPNAFNFQN